MALARMAQSLPMVAPYERTTRPIDDPAAGHIPESSVARDGIADGDPGTGPHPHPPGVSPDTPRAPGPAGGAAERRQHDPGPHRPRWPARRRSGGATGGRAPDARGPGWGGGDRRGGAPRSPHTGVHRG